MDAGRDDPARAGVRPAFAATKTSLHLACIRGPDTGAVAAVAEGAVLGREQDLTDAFTDAQHLVFRDTTGGFVACDVGGANPVRALGRTVKLRPGRRLRVGSNTWIVRSRTGAGWEFPGDRPASGRMLGAMRFILPLMLLSGAARMFRLPLWALGAFAGVVLAAGSVWLAVRVRKKQQQRDPSALLMALAQRVVLDREQQTDVHRPGAERTGPRRALPDGEPGREGSAALPASTYRIAPRRPRCAPLPSPGLHGVVGRNAHGYALWIGAQIIAAGGACRVVAGTRAPDQQVRPDRVMLAWAARVEDLRVPVCSAIPSGSAGGESWRRAMHQLVRATNPPEPPSSVDLASLLQLEAIDSPRGAAAIRDRWARDLGWKVPIAAGSEPLCIDLPEHGPHALVVGGTGSGKSELLTTLVLALASSVPPDRLRMVFIDYKGGAGLDHLADLPHAEQSISDLDGSQTPWLLRALAAEVRKRKQALLRHGFRAMGDWVEAGQRNTGTTAPPPALLVVVDEIRALADRDPALLRELAAIGAQGRSLGLHLVLATQRPGGAVTADMRAVLDLRVALRCSEAPDSQDAIGSAAAAELPRVPGRAIVRTQAGTTEVQCAIASDPMQWVRAISMAWESDVTPSFPVPLPDDAGAVRSMLGQVGADGQGPVIGLYEEAETCRLRPLCWRGDPLLLVGAPSAPRELQEMALELATGAAGRGGREQPERPADRHAPPSGKAEKASFTQRKPTEGSGTRQVCATGRTGTPSTDRGARTREPGIRQTYPAEKTVAASGAGSVVWVGDPPASGRPPGSPAPPLKTGEIVFHLRRTLDQASSASEAPPVVVVPEFSRLLTDLAASAGPEPAQQVARELIDAGRCGLIRLICTDTNPGSKAALFPVRLMRITSADQLTSAPLAGLIPSAEAGGTVSRAPGRVMCWTQDLGLVHCRLVQPAVVPRAALHSPSRFGSIEPRIPPESQPRTGSHSMTPSQSRPAISLTVVAAGRDDAQAVVNAMGGEEAFSFVEHVDASAWTRLASDPGLAAGSTTRWVAALEPTREMARALVSWRRSDAAWVLASIPFPPGTGLVCQGRTARPFSLLRGTS